MFIIGIVRLKLMSNSYATAKEEWQRDRTVHACDSDSFSDALALNLALGNRSAWDCSTVAQRKAIPVAVRIGRC